ncbi:NAD(P)-dependent oxidoreductase [Nocardia sp. NPDC050406]|uniref:NAD(P)-dependent oxidoreductase n=1 Tax=Nocardia sp. NPDC050406 TaxID=3364318 RepID=UPI003790B8AE
MRIAVFGSTGTLGSKVVAQALADGHEVTAFTRNAGNVSTAHERLRVVVGDVLDPAAVEQAVIGQDAVIVCLGSGRKGVVRAEGTKAVIGAMERHGVKRLICQSTLGAGDSHANLNFLWKYILFGMLLRPALADHNVQEEYVRKSNLDWTIVRPSAFTDGPRTDVYRTDFGPNEKGLSLKISRADIAAFLLAQLDDTAHIRTVRALSN